MHKQTRMMEPMEGEFLVMDNYRNVTVDVAEDCAFMCYNGGQEECTGFELDEPTLLCQYYRRRLDTTDLMPLLGKQFPASIVLVPIMFLSVFLHRLFSNGVFWRTPFRSVTSYLCVFVDVSAMSVPLDVNPVNMSSIANDTR